MRYAIYLTPADGSALLQTAEAWLGRSAYGRAPTTPCAPAEAKPQTPARYGFHATMRAPFRLADDASEADLKASFAAFCGSVGGIDVRLKLAELSSFIALVAEDNAPLAALAGKALAAFEPLRAPLTEAERARRKPQTLDARGTELLDRWGYPHVEERFLFHMTLSGSMEPGHTEAVRAAAQTHFAPYVGEAQPLIFALFAEAEPNGPFQIIADATRWEGV